LWPNLNRNTTPGHAIEAGETLLFLDEIQAAPQALGTLRYFHEEMLQLHVICAGSLLAREEF
jgi:uncharacterized protein